MSFRNPKLLFVDDSEIDVKNIYIELIDSWKNLTYKHVDNIVQFQAAIYESSWDAIISEYAFTGFKSLEALELLRTSNKDIPFIIYSRKNDEQIALAAIHHGASDYLYKGNSSRLILSVERELNYIESKRKQRQAESQFFHISYYDELTGLPKYKLFCEKAYELLSNRINQGKIAAVYCIDLDRLPRINMISTNQIGDVLIKQFVYRLSVLTGKNCLFTRLEGGKFVFLNGDISTIDDVQIFANQILKLGSMPFLIDNLEFYITLKIGVSLYPADGAEIEVLLANSENALSLNKGSLRNSYKFYTKEIGEAASRLTILGTSLRRALEKNELILYYQPVVDISKGKVIGAETLVHWNHPEFGLLSPDEFIPFANETGFIVEIGKWVLLEACNRAKFWRDAGGDPIFIAINISASELDQSNYISYVADVIKKTKLDPAFLELDITESILSQENDARIKALCELKQMGIKIAIDNFGVGYSSLSCLKRYPVDILKIDHSFAKDMISDSDSSLIVKAIVSLAKCLNVTAQVKGIETQEQLEFLTGIRCNRAQGFLFSQPVTGDCLLSLIRLRKTGTFQ